MMTSSLIHSAEALPQRKIPDTAILAPTETFTTREALLQSLHGQQFRVNDLQSAFGSWPFAVNPAVDRLRTDIDDWISSTFSHHPKVKKLRRGDYGLFGATWWPYAPYERVSIATRLAVWLFVWDDEIDLDDGSYAFDFERAQTFRQETLEYVKSSIGLDDNATTSSNPIISSFGCIGRALRSEYSMSQRQNFYNEILFFMEKSEVEQHLRQGDRLPDLDEFWRFRLGTSAVRVVLAMNEFCNGSQLPQQIFDDESFQEMVKYCNINICGLNDLLSIRKEIEQGSIESLIPIGFAQLGSVQEAADVIVDTCIRDTVKALDTCADEVTQRWSGWLDPVHQKSLSLYIEGCRTFCTGNMSWSLSTGRYGVHQEAEAKVIIVDL